MLCVLLYGVSDCSTFCEAPVALGNLPVSKKTILLYKRDRAENRQLFCFYQAAIMAEKNRFFGVFRKKKKRRAACSACLLITPFVCLRVERSFLPLFFLLVTKWRGVTPRPHETTPQLADSSLPSAHRCLPLLPLLLCVSGSASLLA